MDQGLLTNSPAPPVCHRTAGDVTLLPKALAEPAFLGEKKSLFHSSEETGGSHHSDLLLYSHVPCVISPEKSSFFHLIPQAVRAGR